VLLPAGPLPFPERRTVAGAICFDEVERIVL